MWPSLKFVYLTTAYFVSQEMIVKLTNESLFWTESYYLLQWGHHWKRSWNSWRNAYRLHIVVVFYFFSCQKLLIFSDIITSLTWLWPNLIILGRSIHPSTHLQSKFCDTFWIYCYKDQVIYAHISYLAVKVPSCSCSSNAPSCLNSKTTICVS